MKELDSSTKRTMMDLKIKMIVRLSRVRTVGINNEMKKIHKLKYEINTSNKMYFSKSINLKYNSLEKITLKSIEKITLKMTNKNCK